MFLRVTTLFLTVSLVFSQLNYGYSGNILFGTINRTSDASLIKIPFRFLSQKTTFEYDTFSINSNLAFEFSLSDNSLTIDNRELYLSWYPNFGEIKIGKQINNWGVGTTNSPLDILSPVNYYYFFSRGLEKNIATKSLSINTFFANSKFGLVYIFEHEPHHLPLDDPEMPITIESLPVNMKIDKIKRPEQLGINLQVPFKEVDLIFSYFKGHDHLMSLFGASLWTNPHTDTFGSYVDTVLSYRSTEVIGIGSSTFIGDMRVNSEIGFFKTTDGIVNDNDILRDFNGSYDKVCPSEILLIYGNCNPVQDVSYALATKSDYYEFLLEIEYPNLIWDISFLGQYLSYKSLDISNGLHPNSVTTQIADIDFRPKYNFIPTIGSPIFMFTMHEDKNTNTLYMHKSSVLFINAKRYFYDYSIESNIRAFWDLQNSGNLIEIEFKYTLSDKFDLSTAINKITGDKNLTNSYLFNTMESFSHIRVEVKYNY